MPLKLSLQICGDFHISSPNLPNFFGKHARGACVVFPLCDPKPEIHTNTNIRSYINSNTIPIKGYWYHYLVSVDRYGG